MTEKELIKKLNWFYSLELSQVELYTAQSKRIDDIYIRNTLERVASIEQQHVDNMAAFIRGLGSIPTPLGDVLAPLVGRSLGTLVSFGGLKEILDVDIRLEQKAMQDYKDLLLQVPPSDHLITTLWSNLIDEDLHVAWLSKKQDHLSTLPV